MKALPLIALFALAAAAGAAKEAIPATPLVIDDITWSFERRDDGIERQLQVRGNAGHTTVSVALARTKDAAGLEPGAPDGPASFALVSDAGRTDCVGRRKSNRASGTCRFVSSPGYEVGLAQRDVGLERRRDLFALALVDARLALVDDLSREGLRPADSGDLIAAAALGITGAWTHELREGGLVISNFNDLIAARALNVDGAFVKAMAAAGYPHLTASQAITMKAVGVTPGYADAMNRAVVAADAVQGLGELQ